MPASVHRCIVLKFASLEQSAKNYGFLFELPPLYFSPGVHDETVGAEADPDATGEEEEQSKLHPPGRERQDGVEVGAKDERERADNIKEVGGRFAVDRGDVSAQPVQGLEVHLALDAVEERAGDGVNSPYKQKEEQNRCQQNQAESNKVVVLVRPANDVLRNG